MTEGYRFREVRKGEREAVLSFANAHGFTAQDAGFRHNLSLMLQKEDETLAAALCVEDEDGRLVVEIVTGGETVEPELVNELANRCLRKVQGEAIGAARLHSPTQEPAEAIMSHANWLDQIQETPPQQAESAVEAGSEASDQADPPADGTAQAA